MICPSCKAKNDDGAEACFTCGRALTALTQGAVIANRYEVQKPIGRGGMGMVYRAHDRMLDETVAIKILRPDFAADPRMAERFKSEIKLARKVRHRNVCAIHDYGEDQGLLFISMELVEGVDLKQMLRRGGGLPTEKAYNVAIQVAEGLQAVHDAGIVHRDLKAPNIMLDEQGAARLMDFGVAKRVGEATLTATGQVVGTPDYMSPEQAQGKRVDFRSDVYALGVLVYEIFTGHVPFHGQTPISTILKHIHDPPPLDGPPAAGIPLEARPVLRRALAKDPPDRFQSAGEFAEALRDARSPSRRQQPVATDVLQAPTLPEIDVAPVRRFMQPWLLVVPFLAVAAGTWMLYQRPEFRPSAMQVEPPTSIARAGEESPAPSLAPTPATSAPATMALAPLPAAGTPPPRLLPPPSSPSARPTPSPASLRATPALVPVIRPPAVPTPSSVTTVPAASTTVPSVAAQPPDSEQPSGFGQLQVVVVPWGSVSVDGKDLGYTPLDRISLAVGPHAVRVWHPSYVAWETRVTIRPGQVERLKVDFTNQGVRVPKP